MPEEKGKGSSVIIKVLNHVFIDGLSGMAWGLFATLIMGTILAQIGKLIGGDIGAYITGTANAAKTLMGAGIGIAVACKFKQSALVTVSAAVAGLIGAFPTLYAADFALVFGRPGEPLGAFVAALAAIEIGKLVSGKTKVDIIVTPFVAICSGAIVAYIVGSPISRFMTFLGNLVNINVDAHPVIGGIVVSVLMGIILTLPISSAAIGVAMGITGLAAGAATIGCCCNMVGFAVASFRDNKWGGLVSQGIGTSMIQMPNIMRKPIIWLPAIISSAILGPIASAVLKMTSTPVGSGMGSAGLVGQFEAFVAMTKPIVDGGQGMGNAGALGLIVLMHFVLPAALALACSEVMRKFQLIKAGDMKLGN
jgi:uncharacterized membrane protein